MKKQIMSISIRQTAKVIALVFFALFILLFVPIGIGGVFLEGWEAGKWFFFLPFIYGFAVYLLCLVGFWFYNHIASYTGGIELMTIQVEEDTL